jgi:tetratricopeptide (TPR) repeat protein
MKMRRFLCMAALAAALAPVTRLHAAGEADFEKANAAYAEGRFEEAAAGYESLVREGRSHANLFYDLGNAWYRLGNFGKAVLNYQRALALEPRHPEADANLRLARDEGRALELRTTQIERYASLATTKQYTIAAATGLWLALFLVTHWYFSRRRSAGRIALIALSLLVTGISIFGIVTLENGIRGENLAVVTSKETEARLATADNAKSILVLPAGSEIKLLSERGGWIYAMLPNEQRGWIAATAVERVRM